MNPKIILVVALLFVLVVLPGCGTIYGAVSDVNLASGWLKRQMNQSHKEMEQAEVNQAARVVLENQKEKGN